MFQSWQHQKWSNSARLPSKMESWVQSWQPRTNAFCDFSTSPVFLTALMNMSLVLRLPRKMHLCRSSSNVPHRFWTCYKPSRFAHFWQGAQSLAPATRNDIWTSKSGPNMWCFVHFDFEMCFAPQRRALFRHLNFQKWSKHVMFCTFWLRNVLRATTACTFRHLNFQKWSKPGVFCTFWLRNVPRATTACTFSTSKLPKVVQTWCVLHILTSKCASRHNGVHFFDIATSKSVPNLVCFVHFDFEMCFAPQRRALFRHCNF